MRRKEAETFDTFMDALPGGLFVDNNRNPNGVMERSKKYLSDHPAVMEHAKKSGKTIYARTTGHGTELIVASAALGVSAVVLFAGAEYIKHKRRHASALHPLLRRK